MIKDPTLQGIAWDAAASVVNQYRNGRFMVPKKDGNSLADICESMCPLFYGGAEAKYRIINYQNFHGENTVHATKLEDVKPRRTRNIGLDQ
ncbi:hypothetical protein ANCDUO_20803 [Ancylostoma duodenale]|uniref:Uncharacterized protein n=1 Tax=Ancylostoma duodenale TaxID=51022 RepID=A0A0C2BYV3_9BILA|nr:hypothetical protein ANCDUO_20803 [Ancylostoma duodenale]